MTLYKIKYFLQFSFLLFFWFCSRGIDISPEFYFHNSGCYCVAAVKSRPDFISVFLFFWSFGTNNSNTFSIENRISLKSVLGGVKYVAFFIIYHVRLYFDLVALEGSAFTRLLCLWLSLRVILVFEKRCCMSK